MKTLIATLSLLLSLDAIGAGVQWNNYPTTNSVPGTATILIGNGSTNLTATATIFGTTQTQPLINTSSNLIYGNANTAINTSSNNIVLLWPTTTNLMLFSGSNGPPVVGQALVIVGTNSSGALVAKSTNWPTGGGGSGSLFPPSALGVLTNTAGGVSNWSTSIPGTWLTAATLPITAADTSWMPVTNAIASTNASKATVLPRQTLLSTGGTNGNGALTFNITNLLMSDLEFHVATNAFTNVVVGYIGPLTNYDGFKFYIPIGTNMP